MSAKSMCTKAKDIAWGENEGAVERLMQSESENERGERERGEREVRET